MSRKKKTKQMSSPVLKARFVFIGVLVIAFLTTLPLFTVWKQVYSNNSSLKIDHLSDSLSVLKLESERLKLAAQKLSSMNRIETIARNNLGLQYPSSKQIFIIEPQNTPVKRGSIIHSEFFALIKKALTPGKE